LSNYPLQTRSQPYRVGWIIGNQLEESRFFHRINVNIGGISLARYHWITARVNSTPEYNLHYEIYRPWRKYDALIFLKSMGDKSLSLIEKYHLKGLPVLFDANVNYYQINGKEYYEGMLPSGQQKEAAIRITETVDAVIADSEFLRDICSQYQSNVSWIPDNVLLDLVPPFGPWKFSGERLLLLWSGEAIKLFELLSIEDLLKKYSSKIKLVLVTNALSALKRWQQDYKARFESLMSLVPHTIIPYQSIEHLFQVYSQGGVVISPRFLDNSYNLGHTEWKITLGMACGRMALCSPVPSYQKVAERSHGLGIRICSKGEDWENIFDEILSNSIEWEKEEKAARKVVEKYYSTPVVAAQHAEYIFKTVNNKLGHQENEIL
jgi:glycosyltransferase involved in cell wall biosynthesis